MRGGRDNEVDGSAPISPKRGANPAHSNGRHEGHEHAPTQRARRSPVLSALRFTMRGTTTHQATMLSTLTTDSLIPMDHPIRRIKPVVEAVLAELAPEFDAMYARTGRQTPLSGGLGVQSGDPDQVEALVIDVEVEEEQTRRSATTAWSGSLRLSLQFRQPTRSGSGSNPAGAGGTPAGNPRLPPQPDLLAPTHSRRAPPVPARGGRHGATGAGRCAAPPPRAGTHGATRGGSDPSPRGRGGGARAAWHRARRSRLPTAWGRR